MHMALLQSGSRSLDGRWPSTTSIICHRKILQLEFEVARDGNMPDPLSSGRA